MKVLGFELQPRRVYDILVTEGIEDEIVSYAQIIYDSIKLNFGWKKIYLSWKYSPKKILQELSQKELIQAVREVLRLDGWREESLVYFDYLLGEKSLEDLEKHLKKKEKAKGIKKNTM